MALSSPVALAAGVHAWFALENATLSDAGNVIKPSGDATAYTTVQRTAKPSAADTSWVKLSGIAKAELQQDNGTAIEVWEPVPGGVGIHEILRVGRKITVKITAQRVQPLTVQLLLSTLALNAASTQFNPQAAPAEVNGWLKVQIYDHKHTLRKSLEVFVELVLSDALTLDPKTKTDPVYLATVLNAELNTGSL